MGYLVPNETSSTHDELSTSTNYSKQSEQASKKFSQIPLVRKYQAENCTLVAKKNMRNRNAGAWEKNTTLEKEKEKRNYPLP